MAVKPWTEAENDLVSSMWMRGHGGVAIAAALQRTRSGVMGKLMRLGLLNGGDWAKRQPSKLAPSKPKAWTAEERENLRKLYASGITYIEIADALNRPRGSVSHQIRTLGISGIKGERAANHSIARYAKSKAAERNAQCSMAALPKSRIVPGSTPVNLFERTGCCFPVNGGGPYLFCDVPLADHGSYCAAHKPYMVRVA